MHFGVLFFATSTSTFSEMNPISSLISLPSLRPLEIYFDPERIKEPKRILFGVRAFSLEGPSSAHFDGFSYPSDQPLFFLDGLYSV